MNYLEENELVPGKYYLCKTYDSEYIVTQYRGAELGWALSIEWEHIRYVIKEFSDLEEIAGNYQREKNSLPDLDNYQRIRDEYVATQDTELKKEALFLAAKLCSISPNFAHKIKMDVWANFKEKI